MAAGIGSRYGAGIKQLAKMDDNGYTLIDYSIFDAIKAGFDKVVFIIRKDIEDDFKLIIGNRISEIIEVEYAYQNLDLPEGFKVPAGRTKPWGTVAAVLAAKDIVNEPFLIINADDYYGKDVYKDLHEFLINSKGKDDDKLHIAMAGYKLKNTLSDSGSVNRGVSIGDKDNKLIKIIETHEISMAEDGTFTNKEGLGPDLINKESLVSMNMWATYPEFIDLCEKYFINYLENNKENLEKAEYVLPEMIAEFLEDDIADVTIIPTNDKWIGITYKEDLIPAKEQFSHMLDMEEYPRNIWE